MDKNLCKMFSHHRKKNLNKRHFYALGNVLLFYSTFLLFYCTGIKTINPDTEFISLLSDRLHHSPTMALYVDQSSHICPVQSYLRCAGFTFVDFKSNLEDRKNNSNMYHSSSIYVLENGWQGLYLLSSNKQSHRYAPLKDTFIHF